MLIDADVQWIPDILRSASNSGMTNMERK